MLTALLAARNRNDAQPLSQVGSALALRTLLIFGSDLGGVITVSSGSHMKQTILAAAIARRASQGVCIEMLRYGALLGPVAQESFDFRRPEIPLLLDYGAAVVASKESNFLQLAIWTATTEATFGVISRLLQDLAAVKVSLDVHAHDAAVNPRERTEAITGRHDDARSETGSEGDSCPQNLTVQEIRSFVNQNDNRCSITGLSTPLWCAARRASSWSYQPVRFLSYIEQLLLLGADPTVPSMRHDGVSLVFRPRGLGLSLLEEARQGLCEPEITHILHRLRYLWR